MARNPNLSMQRRRRTQAKATRNSARWNEEGQNRGGQEFPLRGRVLTHVEVLPHLPHFRLRRRVCHLCPVDLLLAPLLHVDKTAIVLLERVLPLRLPRLRIHVVNVVVLLSHRFCCVAQKHKHRNDAAASRVRDETKASRGGVGHCGPYGDRFVPVVRQRAEPEFLRDP